jgi:GR25 family glycosyltransferase involved in LPS biosynthesis
MNIPIFCINLERATERKDSIQKQWIDKIGLDIIFWKAYDRRDIERNIYPYPYNKDLTIKNLDRELSSGEIACSTSFCMLYEHILDNNYEEVIIMEDDIFPLINDKQQLFDTITEGKKEFPSAEIILLHKPKTPHGITIQKIYTSMCKKSSWGNQLFFIKKSSVIKAYDILKPMFFPADYPQTLLCNQGIVTASNNGLCGHHWRGQYSTTYIGNDIRKNVRRNFIK